MPQAHRSDPFLEALDAVQRPTSAPRGLLTPGNIDLYAQPKVKNPDGSTSTVNSLSVRLGGREVLLPTVTPDGRHLRTTGEAVAEYRRTGRHLGIFADVPSANAYAEQLHNDYAAGKYDAGGQESSDPFLTALDDAQTRSVTGRAAEVGGGLGGDRVADVGLTGLITGEPRDERSGFARAWDVAFTPPEAVSQWFARRANEIDAPSLERTADQAWWSGFKAGAVEGVGSLITPGDVALLATGPFGRVVRSARPALQAINRIADAGMVLRGAERVLDAGTLPQAAAGVAQMAGGSAGLYAGRARPAAPVEAPRVRGALPPGAGYIVAPDGRVVPAGTDISMTAAPDGSFVRGVRAQPAQREVRGLLPGGRARFVAGEHGPAIPAEQADAVLRALDEVQGRPPAESGVRGQRAAVVEREVDVTRPTHEAITVRQYSSDPNAADVPLLGEDDLHVLRVMRDDLREFTPEQGRLVPAEGETTASVYAAGTRGSGVGDDIRVISGQHVSNAKIADAIDDLVAGKAPTNKLHIAALDALRGYREGRGGYKGTTLPMEAADVAAQGAAGAGSREPAAVDDFESFARIFDEVEPGGGREPGEAGFILPELAIRAGGAVAGGAAGVASGEDTQERWKRGTLFAVAGAVAPSLLRRPGAASAAARVLHMPIPAGTPAGARPPLHAVPSPSWGTGVPMREPLRGFEPFLSKFSNPLVREGVESLIAENSGYAAQRRGTISHGTLGAFAHEVRVNVSKALPKGTALNAESITAYGRALQETQRKVNELAGLVQAGHATDADLIALQAARAEADVVAKSLVGARAEAGRALAAFNFYRGILDTGNVEIIRDALKAPGLREEAQRIARGLSEQGPNPIARYRWLQQQQSSSLMDKIRSYYYANILSGVKTHERNILGNVANIVSNLAVHPVAAGLDVAKSAVRGTPRTVRLDEMPSQVAGAVAGLERGLRDFAFTMRHGMSPDTLRRGVHAGELGKLDIPRVEFAGGGANPFNIPGRLLDASDTLFRSVARNAELYGLAHAQASLEGLRGPRFLERVAELRAGTTPDAVGIQQQADAFATRTVFQEQPGPFASWLQLGARKFPPLSFILPFIKTPANIARQGLEFSPAGVLMKAARQGGRAGTQAQARAALGTVAAGALAYYAATGRLSGDGPRDPAQRAALMERGWRPNAVKLGDQWVSYSLFQPVSVQASIIANAYEGWHEAGAKADTAADVVSSTLARSANSFLSQSFLSGLSDFIEAINDPDRSAARVAARTATGLLPLSGLMRTVQQAADPVVRRPEGVAEGIAAAVPGLSEQVQPRIDRFGQVVTREGGPLRRAVDPFNVSSEQVDPIAQELDRLGVRLTPPSDTVTLPGGQTLTREQDTEVRQRRGRAVRAALEAAITTRAYERMSDERRIDLLERVIDRARQRESARLRRELPRRAGAPGRQTGAPRSSVLATRARAKFAGVGPRGQPITRAELESLVPELSEVAGRALTYEDVKAEAQRRGLRVVGQ